MAASILFDQIGLPAGVPGRARSDGLDTGATVTVTNASGQPCRCEFWWIPPDDTVAALSQNSPIQWEFDPEAARYGEYIVRMIEAEGTPDETVDVKAFGIRLPNSGLLISGLNSSGDFNVNLSSSPLEKVQAAIDSFQNEPLPDEPSINYANWWQAQRELFMYIETLGGGGGGTTVATTAKGLANADTITPTVAAGGAVIINLPNIAMSPTTIAIGAGTPALAALAGDHTVLGSGAFGGFSGTGASNTIIGKDALDGLSGADIDENVVIGDSAGPNSGSNRVAWNTVVGYNAAESIVSAMFSNVVIGAGALLGSTTVGSDSVFIGRNVAQSSNSTSTAQSVVIGSGSGFGSGTIDRSTIVGAVSGLNSSSGVRESVIVGDAAGNNTAVVAGCVIIGRNAADKSGGAVTQSVVIGTDSGLNGSGSINSSVLIGSSVGDHASAHSNSIVIGATANNWDDGTDCILIGVTANTPIANISNYLNIGSVLTGDIATQKGAIGAGNSIDITPQLAKFGAYTISEVVAASAVHSTDGTHPAISKTFVSDRDPNGIITGAPGDFCVVSNGTGSTLYQHRGASADDASWVDTAYSPPVGPDGCLLGHTGWLSGGVVTINGGDPTLIDISAGSGWVVDHSNPLVPVCVLVSWDAIIGIAITDIATSTSVSIGIEDTGGGVAGVVQLSNAAATPAQYREYIMLGAIVIDSFTSVDEAFSVPGAPAHNGFLSFNDFIRNVTGPANAGGNIFTPNGVNLSLNKSAGNSFSLGANSHNDARVPDLTTDPQITLASFRKAFRSATPGVIQLDGPAVTVLDPTQWDDGSGTLQTVPTNDYTVIIIYWSPIGTDTVFSVYGQEVFNTETEALEALRNGTLSYEERPQLKGLLQRAYIVIEEGETDLNNATIIDAPAFRIQGLAGAIGGGGSVGAFLDLTDTPPTYAGQANQFLKVNAGENAVEFTPDLPLNNNDITGIKSASFDSTFDNGNVSGAVNIDFAANGHKQEMTLTGNVTALTFAFPTGPASGFVLKIRQDGVGSRTVAFGAGSTKESRGAILEMSDDALSVTGMYMGWDGTMASITTIPNLQPNPVINNV